MVLRVSRLSCSLAAALGAQVVGLRTHGSARFETHGLTIKAYLEGSEVFLKASLM